MMEQMGPCSHKSYELFEQPFRWVAGVEGSVIPHLNIDQYRWTQHDQVWRHDLERAATELKCRWLRYSVPWATVQPAPDRWDWSWCDERFNEAARLGIQLIVDLVHFGVPAWLPDAFGDLNLPDAMETFARGFGLRYRRHPAVASVCPINEPLVTAFFAGDVGLWPPHGTGLQTYMLVLSRIAQALSRAIKALRETMPGVEVILCDSLEVAKTDEPESSEKTSPHLVESLGADVARRMERRHIVMDLVLGRVGPKHALYRWLLQHGFSPYELNWFQRHPQRLDVIGLDYYHHTEVELFTSPEGYFRQRPALEPYGLFRACQDYWHRYHLPFMISETSAAGPDAEKLAWLDKCVTDLRKLRAAGFPCIGFTWWPLLDHLDWDGAMLHQTGHIHPVGIYSLRRAEGGELLREPTALADRFRALSEGGDAAVGRVVTARLRDDTKRESVVVQRREHQPRTQSPVIIYSPHPWEPWRSRSHHLAEQLSADRQVLFVEPPVFSATAGAAADSLRNVEGSSSLGVFRFGGARNSDADGDLDAWFERLVARCSQAGFPLHDASHWVQHAPAGGRIREAFPHAPLVFDVLTGEIPAGSGTDAEVCRTADAIVVRSQSQRARCERIFLGRAHFIPDGVEPRHLLKATRLDTVIPHDSRFIHRPVLAYVGSIDKRLDLRLLAKLACETPDWNIVMIGPVNGISPESLPRVGKIFWLGPRPYAALPNYLRGVDACIVPFERTPGLDDYMPAKVYEYLCAGRPVVAPATRELVGRNFAGVLLAGSRREFIEACHRAVAPMTAERRRELIRQVIGRPWRRVAR
ncbi:MAG: family 1 glycosylhydrolase, partial [Verrucomicrobia bacterium]|nr:family 1 glycosylhydrolase [Verrucomicrobiota bacterium]